MLQRWTAAGRLSGNTLNGVRYQPAQLFPGGLPATAGAMVDRAVVSLLDRAPTAAEHTSLLGAFGRAEGADTSRLADASTFRSLVGTVLASPSFQLR